MSGAGHTPVEVIQADREAAADLIEELVRDRCLVGANAWTATAQTIRNGAWHPMAQTLAHHRVAASTPLLEALEKIARGEFNCSPHQRFMAAQGVAEAAIAAARGEAA